MGSAGSGKSFYITQKLVLKGLKEQRRILVCRRYGSTLRNSVFELFKNVLLDFGLLPYSKVRESDMNITLPNGTNIIFIGLDDEQKLLSIAGITDVFIEEVFEVSKETVDQLSLRMRGKAKNQQIYMAFNPISPKHWLYEFCEGEQQPNSFYYRTVDQLSLRMRGKAKNQQIYMAFNPISPKHWLYEFCEGEQQPNSFYYSKSTFRDNPFLNDDYVAALEDMYRTISPKHWLYEFCEGEQQPNSFYYSKSTFRDNPFLNDDYVAALEDMYRTNPNKAKIYCDGEWGADVEGLVYKNVKFEAFDVQELIRNRGNEVRCGMDIGFIDPTAIVATIFNKKERKIYVFGEYYKRGATLEEIAQAVKDMGIEKQRIFCDSADPRAVDFMRRQGLRAEGAKKGQGSVKAGVSYLQNMEIIVHPDCKNVRVEFENFVYLKDKKTGQYQEDSYDHDFSHSLDALRYAYSDIYTTGSIKAMTLNFGI